MDWRRVRRGDYAMRMSIQTRWSDYDLLRHVNNVQYNRYIEMVVLQLLDDAGHDWLSADVIPFAAESLCRFHKPMAKVVSIDAAIRVGRLGTRSVTYEVALFVAGDEEPSATGHFVHVFVDRQSERPVPIPTSIRSYFETMGAGRLARTG